METIAGFAENLAPTALRGQRSRFCLLCGSGRDSLYGGSGDDVRLNGRLGSDRVFGVMGTIPGSTEAQALTASSAAVVMTTSSPVAREPTSCSAVMGTTAASPEDTAMTPSLTGAGSDALFGEWGEDVFLVVSQGDFAATFTTVRRYRHPDAGCRRYHPRRRHWSRIHRGHNLRQHDKGPPKRGPCRW